MFTGLVLERGRVVEPPTPSGQGGKRFRIGHSEEVGSRLGMGASLAVSGVCLTVIQPEPTLSTVELSPETLALTNLQHLGEGDVVNLEPSLRAGDPLGGHWVQGHVDGTIAILDREDLTDHRVLTFEIPPEFAPYIVQKGSVALDGVSLTVANRQPDRFDVALIPHTLEVTSLGLSQPGDRVNLEVDLMAKYVFQMLQNAEWLRE